MLIQLELGSWRLMSLRLSQWKGQTSTRLDYQNNNLQWRIQGRGPGGPPAYF